MAGLWCWVDSLPPVFQAGIESWKEEEGEGGGGDCSSDYDDGEGLLDFRAGTAGEEDGDESDDGEDSRHHDRAEPSFRAGDGGFINFEITFFAKLVEIGDQYHSVHDCRSKQGNEANEQNGKP